MLMSIEPLRKKAGLTQAELARIAKVTQSAVSQWEKGLAMPNTSKLPNIAKALGCSIQQLYGN
ncbi:MAG: helix-turn-helix transcriptional regulator [Subdoligranulum sp.]|nr:helix-turn-helix transcriptional regulator [Subdoligranulum sp.]MBD5102204.1 helix-turn-helix transcriptional regulator [Subdoligranulum sp.]